MKQYLNQSFLLDIKFNRKHSCDNDTDNECHKKIKCDLLAESQQTPDVKPIDTSVDSEMFCLDEIFLEECDNLSHISENINTSEKWHDETLEMLLDGSMKRPAKQHHIEEEEEREQDNLREELSYILESVHQEQQKKLREKKNQDALIEACKEHGGKLISLNPLLVECAQGHQWETSNQKLLQKEWCTKCRGKHNHPMDWRNKSSMCKECKYQQKLEMKRQKTENRKRNFDTYEKQQDEMLKQAKESFKCNRSQKIIQAFREMENEIEKVAQSHAERYLKKINDVSSNTDADITADCMGVSVDNLSTSSSSTASSQSQSQSQSPSPTPSPIQSPLSFSKMSTKPRSTSTRVECLVALYKVLLLPEDALSMYVKSQTLHTLMQEYRSMAKLIHPDKNHHPKSRLAFTKLRKHWVDRM